MTNVSSRALRRYIQLTMLAGLTAALLLARPDRAFGQTALEAYQECMLAAGVAANNCYMSADGYWQTKACDWSWDINKFACVRSLARALGI